MNFVQKNKSTCINALKMPIIVKDYTWEETDKQLFISVPLKGVKSNKVDILSSEKYIKVRFSLIIAQRP